jgi:hypothetical protein
MKHPLLAVLILLLSLIGCASASQDGGTTRRQANALTQAEIEGTRFGNAHELVSALRPNWLTQRGTQSFSDPTAGTVRVYVDGNHAGDAEALRSITVQDVLSMQYLSASEAQARFGSRQNMGGAILVTTQRAR